MISPIIFASILNSLSSVPFVSYEDFVESLSYEEQMVLEEEGITNYFEFDDYFVSYLNEENVPNRDVPNPYQYATSSNSFFLNNYPEYTWQLDGSYELAYVSGHEPVSIGSSLFPESDITAALQNTLVWAGGSTYGGCGPRAIIGVFDYLARYLNYWEFMANPDLSPDRIALAHSIFQGAWTISFTPDATFMGPLSYESCFSSVVSNNGLSNIIGVNCLPSEYGCGQVYLDIIMNSISKGLPVTMATLCGDLTNFGPFTRHYFNIFGVETWIGTNNSNSNDVIIKKLLKCKANFVSEANYIYYLDASILSAGPSALFYYSISFDESYDTNAQTYSSFVNNSGGGQYFYYEKSGNINLVNDQILYHNRLRTSYILDEYLVMSPKRVDAGTAYLTLTPGTTRAHHIKFDAALWSDYEEVQGQTFVFEYRDANSVWHTLLYYGIDAFSTNRDIKYTFNVMCPRDTHGVRFKTVHPNPSDTFNRGRIVLDNIQIQGNI